MHISCDSLLPGARAARGLAVIIDVFRAFTCAPLMFSLGIEKIILVSTPAEGFALKTENPDFILVGEVGGIPIEGFDLGNSPTQILKQDSSFFKDRTVVQRTSSGVQGALAALGSAEEVLLGSYALAKATTRYIQKNHIDSVSIVAMGWNLQVKAPEDEHCARYIAHLLGDGDYNHNQALRDIIFHETTQKFLRGDKIYYPPSDPILCLQRDIYRFVLRAERMADRVIVNKIPL
ncbi:MAG: 2-phosphosulfolactate phosphatase [Thermodesulfobacteriota bacterium]